MSANGFDVTIRCATCGQVIVRVMVATSEQAEFLKKSVAYCPAHAPKDAKKGEGAPAFNVYMLGGGGRQPIQPFKQKAPVKAVLGKVTKETLDTAETKAQEERLKWLTEDPELTRGGE